MPLDQWRDIHGRGNLCEPKLSETPAKFQYEAVRLLLGGGSIGEIPSFATGSWLQPDRDGET